MNELNDHFASLDSLKSAITKFITDREWEKYQNPKNLAMSVGVEAGELLEIFQWLSLANSKRISKKSVRGKQVSEELADVIIYCLMLAMALDIDVTSAVFDKIRKNELKYPLERYSGTYHSPKTGEKF